MLAIIVADSDGPRLATALTLAAAAAALGRRVTMLFDGASVTALRAPHDALLTAAIELGVAITACQTGLAGTGMSAGDLPTGVTTGGMIGFVAAAGDAQLVLG